MNKLNRILNIKVRSFFALLSIIMILLSCKSTSEQATSATTINSKASQEKPYLFLISLDGFRWDYVEKYKPPHLSRFIESGVKAESLIPSFPSKTFPNHYTIATGMYPDKHGIIGNRFYSYKQEALYKLGDRDIVEDGRFYGGTPIWIQANNEKMVTASYFFVGTEANVQGIFPTYYYRFDNKVTKEVRVNQAIKWLEMPAEKRPHLITMYFSDMDDTGHKYGPENDDQLKKTLFELDRYLGKLFDGIKETGLAVNIMIVSDHGMSTIEVDHFLAIEEIENEVLFKTINNGAILNIHLKEKESLDSIYVSLKKKENNFRVYKTKDTPGFEYVPNNKDWGEIQVIPDFGYYFSSSKGIEIRKTLDNTSFGVHGYDPIYKDMHGIFYASGPAFSKGEVLPSIKNIHLYPLMCAILELEVPKEVDGELKEVEAVLLNHQKK